MGVVANFYNGQVFRDVTNARRDLWPAPTNSDRSAAMAQKPAAGSFEQLQEALFGPGAASSGGLPPGTDREEVRAPRN